MSVKLIRDVSEVRCLWRAVFSSNDPFTFPFRDKSLPVVVFYPTDFYHLTKVQYEALADAAGCVGDAGCYVSLVELAGDFLDGGRTWWCDFCSYEDYRSISLPIENSLLSPLSRWGVLVSHESHAIVGGSRDFIERLKAFYPCWIEDVQRLRQDWRGKSNEEWVEEVLGQGCVRPPGP